jgi:hypothetical protein
VKSELLQCSWTRAEGEFGAIEGLRNGLAHANNYASTKESADKTIGAVRLARNWIAVLQRILNEQHDADRSGSTE